MRPSFQILASQNGISQRYKLVVQWFLHFIYEIGLADKENKHGDNCVVFLESVRSQEHADFMIGDRIHFFTNRKSLEVLLERRHNLYCHEN